MQIFENSFLEVKKGTDKVMLVAAVLLFIIGVAAIYSAGYSPVNNNSPYALRQFVFGMFGFVLHYFIMRIGYKNILKTAIPLSCLTIIFFLLLLIVGHTSKGAQSWFDLGFIRLQPSELGKIVFALMLARFCTIVSLDSIKGIVLVFGVALLFIIPIMLQPDLGSALVYSVMLFALLIIGGASSKLLIGIICAGFAMLPAGWLLLKPYQKMRILVFMDPSIDPQGAGYNVIQSLVAFASGGISGLGYGSSKQKLAWLPEAHTDFIYAVIGEEHGFIGCLLIICLFWTILQRGFLIATKCQDMYGKLLAMGLTFSICFQGFLNMWVASSFVPATGVPMPFISYGGSSVMVSLWMVGILLNISKDNVKRMRNYTNVRNR